jgi:hypothetical protein
MKHILPLNEWVQVNESYFGEGDSFSHLKEKGLEIMSKLINKYKFSEQTAAAFVGNMFAESEFDPKKNGTFKGLIQWDNTRFGRMSTIGIPADQKFTVDAQLKLINYEVTKTAEKGGFDKINAASNVEDAAERVATYYERCAIPLRRDAKRLKSAKEFYDLYQESKLPAMIAFKAPEISPDDENFSPPVEDQPTN